MLEKMKTWFVGLSRASKIGMVIAALTVAGVAASANTSRAPAPAPSPMPQTQPDKVEKKTVAETEVIPFEKTKVNDGSLAKGKTEIRTAGANGVKTLTYEITTTNGVQTDKQLVKDEITTAPVTEVTVIGTFVAQTALSCPNGTYTNTYGNVVCSPYSAPSAPAGATAQCNDGTYSFSQTRSGTCSHHGGVSSWL